ncbi:MAG: class I SAM-dependent methyltransferase [Acidimicrobiales bacterium]
MTAEAPPEVDYYRDRYWNDLEPVVAHLKRLATGSEAEWWTGYVTRVHCTPPRRRALVIGCGNGWVERELFDLGAALEFDAFDVSERYVAEAEAARGGRPITYRVAEFRTWRPRRRYDLIVNVAALHHAQHLRRVTYRLARALEPGGVFVNWEYVGPDRNIYSDDHLARLRAANAALPAHLATPHPLRSSVRHMAAQDPTEAVHASEIIPTLEACFSILERRDLGGGLAYPLLWNNVAPFTADPEAEAVLGRLLTEDAEATARGEIPTLFTFLVAGPRPGRPSLRFQAARLVAEPVRETLGAASGGLYGRMGVDEAVWRVKRWYVRNREALKHGQWRVRRRVAVARGRAPRD